MNIIQDKLTQAAKLLLEVHVLAKENGIEFRKSGELANARVMEDIADRLHTNTSITIEQLAHFRSRMNGLSIKTESFNEELLKHNIEWVFRHSEEII